MDKEFVTYKQALDLKELGFDEPCIKWYTAMGNFVWSGKGNQPDWSQYVCSAPLKSQVFKWFREKYNLYSTINLHDGCNSKSWRFHIYRNDELVYNQNINTKPYYETYEAAESACIDKLIELVKQKQNENNSTQTA